MDASLLRELQAELELGRAHGLAFSPGEEHTRGWNARFAGGQRRLIDAQGRLDPEALESFRRLQLFTRDNPRGDASRWRVRNLLSPRKRRERRLLEECLAILEARGYDDLLARHPSPEIGRPHLFRHRGYGYTHRWFKHVYALGLLREVLGDRLGEGFTSLDIGSAYGVLQALLHREHPGSHHVLVDLPEPLLLASYFLRTYLPGARVAGLRELLEVETVTRDWLERYDFVLVPPGLYDRIAPGSIDLVTSFAALGELTRETFLAYVRAPVFQTARYFATANPVVSARMFADSDVTVLDYPIWDAKQRLHFDISPAYFHPYAYPAKMGWRTIRAGKDHAFFEYIGGIAT